MEKAVEQWCRRGDQALGHPERRGARVLPGPNKNVTCVTFSPDGHRLASSSSDRPSGWDGTASPKRHTWRATVGPIARIAFFPDGHRLLVAENIEDAPDRISHHLPILDAAHGLREAPFYDADDSGHGRPMDRIAIRPTAGSSPRHRRADGSRHGRSRTRNLAFATMNRPVDSRTSPSAPMGAGWPPRVRWVPVCPTAMPPPDPTRSATAWCSSLTSRQARSSGTSAGVSTGLIRDIAFSPDGQALATADNTSTITIWDSRTGGALRRLRGHNRLVSSIAFSPDGTKLASASWDSTVVVWDLAGSRAMTRLQGHMHSVLSVAFSPDGRRLATSSEDQTVRLWDVETGQEVLTLHGHTDIVPTVAFSPDGNRLATAGADGIVLVREAGPAYGTGPGLNGPEFAEFDFAWPT